MAVEVLVAFFGVFPGQLDLINVARAAGINERLQSLRQCMMQSR